MCIHSGYAAVQVNMLFGGKFEGRDKFKAMIKGVYEVQHAFLSHGSLSQLLKLRYTYEINSIGFAQDMAWCCSSYLQGPSFYVHGSPYVAHSSHNAFDCQKWLHRRYCYMCLQREKLQLVVLPVAASIHTRRSGRKFAKDVF